MESDLEHSASHLPEQAIEHFDLAVIGAGSGNSIIDEQFADQKVALVDLGAGERGSFGGTCLNNGCIPTKMFVLPADYVISASQAARVGVALSAGPVDFAAIRERIFARIDAIADAGLAWREQNSNVTLFREAAVFVDAHTLRIGRDYISADQIVLAAGSRPRHLDVPGADDPDLAGMMHTNETIMRVNDLPRRLIILGGGVEAVEFAHVFSALGSHVTLIHRGSTLLRKSDADIARTLTNVLASRMSVRLNQQVARLSAEKSGGLEVTTVDANGIEYEYTADAVLMCLGRVPNSDLLNVQHAGVHIDQRGFVVADEFGRTGVANIWALGDICNPLMLKHVANAQARTVQHNLLHPDDLIVTRQDAIPRGIFTHPQIAELGATEAELAAAGAGYVTIRQPYGSTAYGWALEDDSSYVKLLGDRSGHLLGAHIIGPQATTLLQPLVQMMSFGMDAAAIARGQYWPHPALTEVIENALLSLDKASRKPA